MVPFFFADVVFRGLSVRVRAATERHVYMCVCVVSCISVFLWSRSSPSNSVRVVLLSAVFFFFSLLLFMRTTYRLLCLLLASLTFTNFGALCLLLITVYCLLVLFCLFLKKKVQAEVSARVLTHIHLKKKIKEIMPTLRGGLVPSF